MVWRILTTTPPLYKYHTAHHDDLKSRTHTPVYCLLVHICRTVQHLGKVSFYIASDHARSPFSHGRWHHPRGDSLPRFIHLHLHLRHPTIVTAFQDRRTFGNNRRRTAGGRTQKCSGFGKGFPPVGHVVFQFSGHRRRRGAAGGVGWSEKIKKRVKQTPYEKHPTATNQ